MLIGCLLVAGVAATSGSVWIWTGRRRRGRRVVPALICAGAGGLIFAVPLVVWGPEIWSAITDPAKPMLMRKAGPPPFVVIGTVACVLIPLIARSC